LFPGEEGHGKLFPAFVDIAARGYIIAYREVRRRLMTAGMNGGMIENVGGPEASMREIASTIFFVKETFHPKGKATESRV
jgi:hypothetical protein